MSADFAWGVLAAFVFLAAAIAVTAAVWDLPRDGIDLGDDPAEPSPLATWQDSREAYRNVRVLPHGGNAVDLTGTPIPFTGPLFAPVTITHYAVGSDDAPGELRCWVCHEPCPSGVCDCRKDAS